MENEWKLLTPLTTVKIGRALWMTLIPHVYMTPKGEKTAPAGFLFDHASVPTFFSNIVPPVKSCIAEGSLPHDLGYCKDDSAEPEKRKYIDEGLRDVAINTAKMCEAYDDEEIANLAYMAVRAGARGFYKKQYNDEKIVDAYKPFKDMGIEALRDKFVISWDVLPGFNFDNH